MSHSIKHYNFCSEPMGNKPVTTLPGVGEVTAGRLNAMGYYKARDVYELLKKFGFDEDKFCSWIKSNFRGCRAYECYSALMKWHRQFGETNTERVKSTVSERTQRDQQPTITRSSPSSACTDNFNDSIFGQNQDARTSGSGFNSWNSGQLLQHPRTSQQLVQSPGPAERLVQSVRNLEQVLRTPPMTFHHYFQEQESNIATPRFSEQSVRSPEQSAQSLRTSGESVQRPGTSGPSAQILGTSEGSVQNLRSPEQSVQSPGISGQLVQRPRTFEPAVQSPRTSEELVQNTRSPEQSIRSPRSSEPSVSSQTTSEYSVQNPRTSEQLVQTPGTSEQRNLTEIVDKVALEADPLVIFFLAMEATVKKLQPVLQKAVVGFAPKPDPIKSFFQGMQDTVKTFEPEMILEIKSEIFKIIIEYERRDLLKRAEPVPSTSAASAF